MHEAVSHPTTKICGRTFTPRRSGPDAFLAGLFHWQIEQQVSDVQSKFKVGDPIPKDAIIAPANLFCPDGTNLTSVDSFGRDENGKLRNQGPVWQCMGEPKRVASKPSSRNP